MGPSSSIAWEGGQAGHRPGIRAADNSERSKCCRRIGILGSGERDGKPFASAADEQYRLLTGDKQECLYDLLRYLLAGAV